MVGLSTGSEAINNYYHIDFGKQGNFSSTFDMRFSDVRKNMQAEDEAVIIMALFKILILLEHGI